MISTEKWSRFEMERMSNRSENRISMAREERSLAAAVSRRRRPSFSLSSLSSRFISLAGEIIR
ncbi:hypothetical protein HanRHA438_Chr09g0385551 [Helianthus annuus]|nr:hypothetical protein HanRHA438_Chr09g0385551 [Helianthus annuus]